MCTGLFTLSSELEMASLSTPCLYPGVLALSRLRLNSFYADLINNTESVSCNKSAKNVIDF